MADSHRRSMFDYYGDNYWLPLIVMAALFARFIPKVQGLANPLTFPASFVLIPLTCPLKLVALVASLKVQSLLFLVVSVNYYITVGTFELFRISTRRQPLPF